MSDRLAEIELKVREKIDIYGKNWITNEDLVWLVREVKRLRERNQALEKCCNQPIELVNENQYYKTQLRLKRIYDAVDEGPPVDINYIGVPRVEWGWRACEIVEPYWHENKKLRAEIRCLGQMLRKGG